MARVCLIDDDIYVRDAMALGLSDAGFDVVTAPGVAAGADIIVTDMHMPGTDGAGAIAQARERWPEMPIIAITGSMTFGGEDIEDVAKRFGVDALMVKPFRASELAGRINALLKKA